MGITPCLQPQHGRARSGAERSGLVTNKPPERSQSLSNASGEPQTSDTAGAGRAARDTQNAAPPYARHASRAVDYVSALLYYGLIKCPAS